MRVVLCAEGPVEPDVALAAYLSARPPRVGDPVHVLFGIRRTPPSLPDLDGLTVGAFLPGRGLRNRPDAVYHRQSYDEICHALLSGQLRPSAVVACCTPPDAAGIRSLGAISGYLQLAIDVADEVVVEEVPWLPRIDGAAQVVAPTQVLTSAHQAGEETVPLARPWGETDRRIAEHIRDLIPENPVLALGIGRVAEALADQLRARSDLDMITGVVTEPVRGLVEAGSLGGRVVRTMSVVGPPSLLDWAATSARVRLLPSTMIHHPEWISQHPRFVVVVGAIDVDPAANVNSERAGGQLVSGLGGAPDLAAGAHASEGGLCIVALPSTDRAGRSTLVDTVSPITIPGANVDALVTEHGSADLRGLSAAQRTHAIRAIFAG